jgi:hypothetical protein
LRYILFDAWSYCQLAILPTIGGKSAVTFCPQVAAWVPDMFCNFYLGKNHKIAKNSTTTKAKEKISTHLKSLEFYEFFYVCLT